MAAKYIVHNGSTFKRLSNDKISCVVTLKSSDGIREVTQITEIESEVPGTLLTSERVASELQRLANEFDANQDVGLPDLGITFNAEIEVTSLPENP